MFRSLLPPVLRAVLPAVLLAVATQAGAAGAPKLTAEQKQAMRQNCGPDIRRLCSDVAPGGGRIAACVRDHRADLSQPCVKTLSELAPARSS